VDKRSTQRSLGNHPANPAERCLAAMGLLRRSIAEIYCPASGSVGSGYFCASRLVLTARHVIAGALSNAGPPEIPPTAQAEELLQTLAEKHMICRVRSLDAGERGEAFLNAVPVWWSAHHDVALLALTTPHYVPPVTWADVPESEPINVTAVGFPEADTEEGIRESRQISGLLSPLAGVKAGRFVIHVSGSIGQISAGAGSSWAGMSGAALFAVDLDVLIGMVLVDADAAHPERLELWALPAHTFADDPSFLHWIRWDGGEGRWIRSKETPLGMTGVLRKIASLLEMKPKWTLDIAGGISNLVSLLPALLAQIQDSYVVDYAIFDLGDGDKWLSTRLYLFTLLLHRIRRVRTILFVDKDQGIQNHFVGLAAPVEVQYALAKRYPWLERAFARTYANLPDVKITTAYGSIDPSSAKKFAQDFLDDEEIRRDMGPGQPGEWVGLGSPGPITKWEHADWLNTSEVVKILGKVLDRSQVGEQDLHERSQVGEQDLYGIELTKDQVKLILSSKGEFLALVDQVGRFKALINKKRLEDKVLDTTLGRKR